MPPLGRFARDPTPVALPFDEVPHVPGHLAQQQAHRHVGQSESEDDRGRHRDENNRPGSYRSHTFINSKRAAVLTAENDDNRRWNFLQVTDYIDMPAIAAALREPLRRALIGERAEWPPLSDDDVRTLVEHGVAPLVYAVAHVPELRDDAMTAAAIEPLRLDDLREVLAALDARGVKALLMKGSALAYDVFASPDLRPRSDTDLLVDPAAYAAAREAMLSLGFREQLTSGDEHGVRQQVFVRTDRFGVAHVYDVHWAIANSPLFADVVRIGEIDALPLPRIGEHAFALPHVEALLLACVHRVAHHHDSERLLWLCDIDLLRARMSDDEHARFWRRAADRRVLAVCARSIALAEESLGREPSHRAERYLSERELAQREASRRFLDRRITYAGVTLANLRALPWSARLRRLRQLAFPPAAFMRQSFPTRSRAALPWLYVYRGARGFARLFRRVGEITGTTNRR